MPHNVFTLVSARGRLEVQSSSNQARRVLSVYSQINIFFQLAFVNFIIAFSVRLVR